MKNKFLRNSVILFFILCLFSFFIVFSIIKNIINIEEKNLKQLNQEITVKISQSISTPINQLYTLQTYIINHNGEISNIDEIANIISSTDYVRNVIVAPNGIVTNVYPYNDENKQFLGLNYFSNSSEGNSEAVEAMQKKELLLSGPFKTVVGDQSISGRLPIYIDNELWGVICMTLFYPEILETSYFNNLNSQNITYELWRNNSDTGEHQIIFSNGIIDNKKGYIDEQVNLLNANWYLRLSPIHKWYNIFKFWIFLIISLFISLMIALIYYKNSQVYLSKKLLENIVYTDSLTGIINRQGLFKKINKIIDTNNKYVLNFIDLNLFKSVNDNFGHHVGDFVLKEFATRTLKYVSKDMIFARIAGDEFILIYNKNEIYDNLEKEFWDIIYKEFEKPIIFEKEKIYISFCKGSAVFNTNNDDFEKIMSIADKNMYINKNKLKK